MPTSSTIRFAVRFGVAATALTTLVLVAQPVHSRANAGTSAQTDVGAQRWGLSNPRTREFVLRTAAAPQPSTSAAPPSSSSAPGTSSAPTSLAPSSAPESSAPSSDVPSSDVPSSDVPTGAPGSDTPSTAPTDDAPTTPSDPPTTANPSTPTPTPSTTDPTTVSPTPSPSSSDPAVTANLPMPTTDLLNWKLVYADSFNGTSLNSKAWSVYGNNPIPSEPDSGYWATSHATVANSMLTLNGSRDAAMSPDGRIVTAGVGLWNMAPQTYGKYEALVRVDACPQVKYAWLLWPASGRWPDDGEIDFAEDGGGDRSWTTGTVIYPDANDNRAILPQERVKPLIPMSGWHVVGVEWTPGQVKYTMDGFTWGVTTSAHVPHVPMTMIMQTESVTPADQVPSSFTSCNAQIGWVAQWSMR